MYSLSWVACTLSALGGLCAVFLGWLVHCLPWEACELFSLDGLHVVCLDLFTPIGVLGRLCSVMVTIL